MLQPIFDRVSRGIPLSLDDAVSLLSTPNLSPDYYALLAKANELSKREFQNRGYIFAQIGLNASPCSGNCKFCSLASTNQTFTAVSSKSLEEILQEVSYIDFSRVTALFLMTTADYDSQEFLKIGSCVRKAIPDKIALVANRGDFDFSYAQQLKSAGFTGAYHIVRLREGVDTEIPPEQRIKTLHAIADAGLRLYYCVEPIGPEHTYEELAAEMLRAREYHVDVMAAMRRVNVPGTAFEHSAMISDIEMAKIVAVTRLVTMPRISMNVHEPLSTAMLAGVNQLYAEIGVNPRDTSLETENSRGFSVSDAEQMLRSAGYGPCIEE